ncbi:MAG: hypothetical protein M3Z04_01010 [Chloroflexota bacterium]|nr:hypothetical protein [Chloroflexota bacterium]
MQEHEIALPAGTDLTTAAPRIEAACHAARLRIARRGTLANYPGCIHWHLQRAGQSGTLELTLWPAGPRLWCKIAAHRAAPWMPATIADLSATIPAALARET